MRKLNELVKKNKTLVANFSYLSIIKLVTMLLPLLTYPYLIKVLGSNTYGLLIYSQAIIGYFVILINFGFNITTTREISKNRDDIEKLSLIISTTYFIKIVLFILSLAILFLLRFWIKDIRLHFDLFFYTLLWLAIYEVLFPIYYFQGIEKMKYISVVTLVSRVIFFVLIFLMINEEKDYIYFPIINFIGSVVAIIISFYILKRDGIKFVMPSFSEIKYHMSSSYIMGIAVGSNTLKSNLNIVLIKTVLSLGEVALFDLVNKLISVGLTVADLISQTVFPKMANDPNKSFFYKLIKLIIIMSAVFLLGYILFGKLVISLLGNGKLDDAYPILILMSLIIPIYSMGTLFGRNCLNIHGYDIHVLYSMVLSSLVYVAIYFLVTYIFGLSFNIYTFVLLYLFSFLIDTIYRYIICKKFKLI